MSEKRTLFYKYCIVPGCTNTTFTTPKKIFISVPRVESLRKNWFEAMGKNLKTKNNVPFSSKSSKFCCEDHFDLENDMLNYRKWKLMGGNILMKDNVVPHIFDCRKSTMSTKERMVEKSTIWKLMGGNIERMVEKSTVLGHIPLLNDINNFENNVQPISLKTSPSCEVITLTLACDGGDGDIGASIDFKPLRVYGNKNKARRRDSVDSQYTESKLRRVNSPIEHSSSSILSPAPKLSDANLNKARTRDSVNSQHTESKLRRVNSPIEHSSSSILSPAPKLSDANLNKARRRDSVDSQHTESKLRRVNSPIEHSSSNILSPPPKLSDANLNKARRRDSVDSQHTESKLRRVNSPIEHSSSNILSPPPKLSDANLAPETANDHTCLNYSARKEQSLSEVKNYLKADPKTQFEDIMLRGTMMSIEKDPKLYLGISQEIYCRLDILCQIIPCDHKDILITLKKIRLNEPCTILATQFAASQTEIEQVFQRTVTLMSKCFKELIHWPTSTNVLKHLPLTFRSRYSKVYCMIDILEVEIQKMDNPVHQRLTWSTAKNCYSVKYIISCTPDGLITYTSSGFGGSTSDTDILKNCGLMDLLPCTNTTVLAERNFKDVEHILAQRSCKIISLPTLRDLRTTEKELETKRIEALRILLQSVIERLRDFKMLTLPNVDTTVISKLDDVIVIVSGLINLQGSFHLCMHSTSEKCCHLNFPFS